MSVVIIQYPGPFKIKANGPGIVVQPARESPAIQPPRSAEQVAAEETARSQAQAESVTSLPFGLRRAKLGAPGVAVDQTE